MLIAFYFVLNMALVLPLLFLVAVLAYHTSQQFEETMTHDLNYRKSCDMHREAEMEHLNRSSASE